MLFRLLFFFSVNTPKTFISFEKQFSSGKKSTSLQDLLRCFIMPGVELTGLRYKAFVRYSEAGGGSFQPYLSSLLSALLPSPATHPNVFPDLRTKEKLLLFKVYSKSMDNKQTHPQKRERPQLST